MPKQGDIRWHNNECQRYIFVDSDKGLQWLKVSDFVCRTARLGPWKPPETTPPPPEQPAPDADPRTLPCTVGETVRWEGKTWECNGQRLRDGRGRTYWALAAEELEGFDPFSGRVTTEESRIIRIVNGVIQAALFGSAFFGLGVAVAPLLSKMQELLDAGIDKLAQNKYLGSILDRATTEAKRIEGVLDNAKIGASIRTLRTLHRIGMATSSGYRGMVGRLYEETGALSRQVFGRAEPLAAAVNLLQMGLADLSSLRGESADAYQSRFLGRSQDLLNQVARESRRYARTPSAFWGDFARSYLDPILAERVRLGAAAQGRIATIDRTLAAADRLAGLTSSRLLAYQAQLDPFISGGKLEQLDRIRRDFDAQVRRPLAEVSDWFRDVWPEQAEVIAGNLEVLGVLEDEVDTLESLIPLSVDQEAALRARRRRVWGDLLEDTLEPSPQGQRPTGTPTERLQRAYTAILGGGSG